MVTGCCALFSPPSLITTLGPELGLSSLLTLPANARPTAYAPSTSSRASIASSTGTNHGESVTFSTIVGSSSYASVRWVPTTSRPRRSGSSSVSELSVAGSSSSSSPSLCAARARSYAAR